MQFFDEKFYVEKKRRIAQNKSNKYRRKSSIDASIEIYLQTLQRQSESQSPSLQCEERIHFPVYERRSTELLANELNFKSNKTEFILTKTDWIVACLAVLINGLNAAFLSTFIGLY